MSGAEMKIAVILSAYDKMSNVINSAVKKSTDKLKSFSASADKLAEKSFNTGKQLVASGLAIGAPIYKAIDAATEFETKMVDIRKQMAEDTPTAVKGMTNDIFKLSKQLPLATGEIQEMIASGLRMGIAQDKIIDYTKQVTKMSVAFDMGAGEIADSMGKIANVFKIPIDKVGEFADTINYLDDNTMAKGPDLIDVLQRIGGAAKALKPDQAAAMASTMLSLGESAETSGSGLSAMLNRLGAATMQGKKFQEGLRMLGISGENLQKSMSNSSTAQFAIMDVFEKINGLKPEKQTEALIRLFGQEHGPKLQKLANNVGELKRQMNLVNGAQKGSMDREYQKRVAATAAQMQIFKNRIHELWIKIGSTLLPSLNKLTESAGKWIDKVSVWIDRNPNLVAGIAKAAAVVSGLALAGGYLSFAFGGIVKLFSIGVRVISFLTRAFGILRNIMLVLRLVFMAFPIIGWVTAIATAVFLIIRYWSKIVGFFKGIFANIKSQYGGFLGYLKAIGKGIFAVITWPFRSVLAFITGTYKAFTEGGHNIIGSLVAGIKKAIHIPVDMVKNMVKKVRNLLPFSPAKDGPLKDIHKIKLVETIAESIKPASMINAMRRATQAAFNFLTKPGQALQPVRAGSPAGGGGPSMTVNINLSGSATAKDGEAISGVIKKEFARLMAQYEAGKKRVSYIN